MPEDVPLELSINLSDQMQAGVYSDVAVVWHGQHGFTLDFLAPVAPVNEPEGGPLQQTATVVARVRVPVGVIFQVARAIGDNVAQYEAKFGPIGPGGPDHPPEEAQ